MINRSKIVGVLVFIVLIGGCIQQPADPEREKLKEKPIETDIKGRGTIITKDIFLPSKSTKTPSGKLAVRLHIPKKEDIRYNGAPIIIIGEGGYGSDGIINKKMPHLNDMIVVTFIYPGGENLQQKRHSDGVYDYRGKKSIEALRDVILYCAGELRDNNGKYIDDLVDYPVLHDNIGFIGFSFGGNIGIAVAALHKEVALYLTYVIQWETPVSSQIATRDLGKLLFQPLEKGATIQGDYFNPRYKGYGSHIIEVDYSDITYDPQSLYPLFLDGNDDGVYTTIMGSYYTYPTPDINDNNILELTEDWGLDTYPYDTYDINGKVVYSRPVTHALEEYNVFLSSLWPEKIATVKEADAYWDIRESVRLYKKALTNIPGLEGMFLLSVDDHVQSDPYKSHAHQAFDGWTLYSTWFQINPDPAYIYEVDPLLSTIFIPYTEPHTAPHWEDSTSYCMPEKVPDEVYSIAAVHQMADRVQSHNYLSLCKIHNVMFCFPLCKFILSLTRNPTRLLVLLFRIFTVHSSHFLRDNLTTTNTSER